MCAGARHAGKVAYPLDEMLLQCLLEECAGAKRCVVIATCGNRCVALDAEAFQGRFIAWVASLTKPDPDIVAIDGKMLRRSYQQGGCKAPIHMFSAFSSRRCLRH